MTQRSIDLRDRLADWEIPAHAAYSPDRLVGSSPNGLDIVVRYDLAVSGAIDKAEWRRFLGELLDETPGPPTRRKEPLARTLGISVRQLTRWLDPEWEGAVSEASVRQVAEKSGRSIAQLFTRLGYLEQAELPYPPADAWIVEVINASKLSPDAKRRMIKLQLAQAAREREEKERQIREQLHLMGEAVTATATGRGHKSPLRKKQAPEEIEN